MASCDPMPAPIRAGSTHRCSSTHAPPSGGSTSAQPIARPSASATKASAPESRPGERSSEAAHARTTAAS
jgi:hypothetical protein